MLLRKIHRRTTKGKNYKDLAVCPLEHGASVVASHTSGTVTMYFRQASSSYCPSHKVEMTPEEALQLGMKLMAYGRSMLAERQPAADESSTFAKSITESQAQALVTPEDIVQAAHGEAILLHNGSKLTWHETYGWLIVGYAHDGSDVQQMYACVKDV